MARVPLLDREDLPEEYRHLLSEDALGERNIFRAIGNNPRVLHSYMRYGTTRWEDAGLTAREREIVILTIARTLRSEYEWHQHVEIGGEAGVTDTQVAAIGRDEHDQFDGRDQALVSYATAFARDEVTEAVHDELAEYCESSTIVGVSMLAGHYVATARVLDSLSVPAATTTPPRAAFGWNDPSEFVVPSSGHCSVTVSSVRAGMKTEQPTASQLSIRLCRFTHFRQPRRCRHVSASRSE